MVRPGLRSHSMKRLKRRTPGGVSKTLYKRRKRAVARCAVCGRPLGGVPTDPKELRGGGRTRKRPERMFGGVLCPQCAARALRIAVRALPA
ncbi:MAG: 50S ribosomal protein L34e [Thermoprotei archaeon]|nr:MAG: 50S ribosomal protein L34e [Thermoprotei archaeon]